MDLHCFFHKHANSKVQTPPSQLRFSLPSIIISITSNEPWNRKTRKTVRNPPITNHIPWPFEPVEVNFCFLRGPLRLLTAAKNVKVSWVLNFRIRVFLKSAVSKIKSFVETEHLNIISRIKSVRPFSLLSYLSTEKINWSRTCQALKHIPGRFPADSKWRCRLH